MIVLNTFFLILYEMGMDDKASPLSRDLILKILPHRKLKLVDEDLLEGI